MRVIESSELIINGDGSIFHLHLKPGQIADTVILVGDPGRVAQVSSHFDRIEGRASNREFETVTGSYKGKRLSVTSTGIGTDNIDIVVNELDALVNIDFKTRTVKDKLTSLNLIRLGTSGGLQPDIEIGTPVLSRTSIGFDGLLNFYKGRDGVCDLGMEQAFMDYVGWAPQLTKPYCVDCSPMLADLFADSTVHGITISAPGFYAPQGRWLRLEPARSGMNDMIEAFRYNGRRITNFEMESSALAGLSLLMGHNATTVCTIIAQRVAKDADTDYKPFVNKMIAMALDKLAKL